MKILLIDNYDSFVFNIVGLLEQCRGRMSALQWTVVRNDRLTDGVIDDCDGIILSPGPGLPAEAGRLTEVIREYGSRVPILGICLGCQAIAEVFGCSLRQLEEPRHGHKSYLKEIVTTDPIVGFLAEEELEGGASVGRYHSWVVEDSSLSVDSGLMVTSRDDEDNIMSVSHSRLPVYGLQFHPESIITAQGLRMIQNFLRIVGEVSEK